MEYGKGNPYLAICGILLDAVRSAIACLDRAEPEQARVILRAAREQVDAIIES